MAIEMQCPACKKAYRLKDELAGKKVTCANAECRTVFAVPVKPGTGTAPSLGALKAAAAKPAAKPVAKAVTKSPPPPAFDVETAALSALNDDPDEVPVETRLIPVKCDNCEHAWTEPWEKQGKNVLCPECRTRQRVPVPDAKGGKTDWRKDGMPAGRKIDRLEGVTSSTEAGYVTGESLRAAGLGRAELEPRPVWQKVLAVGLPIAAVVMLGAGVVAFRGSRADTKEVATMDAALKDSPGDDAPLPKGELPLFRVGILIAAGEYAARRDDKTPKQLAEALGHFSRARQDLEGQPSSFGRDALFAELAAAELSLGGTQEQVDAGQRYRYVPQAAGAARARISEKAHDVQSELKQTFAAMLNRERPVALEARYGVVRRLTRELAKVGHPDLIERLVPTLFNDAEHPEATAVAIYEAAKASPDPARINASVEALLPTFVGGRAPPAPLVAVAQTLTPVPPALKLAPYSPGPGPIDDNARATYGMLMVLQNKPGEAIELAKRPGRTDSRLKLLALVAELSPDPGAAVAAAGEIYAADGRKRDLGEVPDALLVRLAHQAGRANQPERIDQFAKGPARDDARAWARADGLRGQFTAGAAKPAVETLVELPADPKDARSGTAWGRLWVARNNAAAGEKRPDGYDPWGRGTYRPYGLAGHALGLQDRK